LLSAIQSGGIEVFDVHAAIASRFRASGFVGAVPAGQFLVGMSPSRDGRVLFVADEAAGALAVIDVHRAETRPARAVTG
jgi:hypothetical protein